jgi:F0F1-type ATP synthase membrane subunit b/b'
MSDLYDRAHSDRHLDRVSTRNIDRAGDRAGDRNGRDVRPADDLDETGDFTLPPQPAIGDTEGLLRRAIDLISTAKAMPLSASVMVNRDEIVELLDEAAARLPEELKRARWMLKERDEFLKKTRREGDDILDAARAQAERLVQRTEVVKAAETRARRILESAESESRRMRHETEDFCDQRLASFEIILDKLSRSVSAGREKLNAGATVRPQETAVVVERDPTSEVGFFDQDR